MTIVCGLIGIGCAVTLPNPAWPYIDVSSLSVYASPATVDVSMVIANAAGIGGDTRSSFGTNSSVATRPPGRSARWTFCSRPTHAGWSTAP